MENTCQYCGEEVSFTRRPADAAFAAFAHTATNTVACPPAPAPPAATTYTLTTYIDGDDGDTTVGPFGSVDAANTYARLAGVPVIAIAANDATAVRKARAAADRAARAECVATHGSLEDWNA